MSYEKSSGIVNNVHVTTVVILTQTRRGSKNSYIRIEPQNLKNILGESQRRNMTFKSTVAKNINDRNEFLMKRFSFQFTLPINKK